MKSIFTKMTAFILLVGSINTTVIEPAICFAHDDAVSQQQENGNCCFVCHPSHHQWIAPIHIQMNLIDSASTASVESVNFALLDSPTRLIFHPPLAL